MIWFALLGAVLGWLTGGWIGLFVGILLGFAAGWLALRMPLPMSREERERRLLDITFAVMGAMCKSDGRVTSAEIKVAEEYFDKLALSLAQRQAAQQSFARGKCVGFDMFGEVSSLRQVLWNDPVLLQLFLQVQLSAVAADGHVHEAKHRLMLRVAQALGLRAADVERIEAMLRNSGGDFPQRPEQAREDAYAVLGVEPSASDAEIKLAYRRLMSRYHPDKFASRGVCEHMRGVAEERVHLVRKAYDTIMRQRAT